MAQTVPGSFPVTPIKQQESIDDIHKDLHGSHPDNDDISTTSTTIRERRGRRHHLSNGSFRPLSVFTKSTLLSFQLDTDRAFEVLKGDNPDRIEKARSAILSDEALETLDHNANVPSRLQMISSPTPLRQSISTTSMTTKASAGDSEMDLITALMMTSPEKDATRKVHADFTTLCALAVPEPSQHPLFSLNPFDIKTDAPLLLTSTSIDDIRLYNHKNNQRTSEQSSRIERDSIERKRSFFGLELRTPGSIKSRNAFSSYDNSPLPISIPTPNTSAGYSSIKGSSPLALEFITPKESASTTGTTSSNSVRKFSDLFRRKDSLDREHPHSPPCSPRNSSDSPNLNRKDLEKFLRRTTNTPTYDHDAYSPYSRHPNTARGWKSRNLKCTNCTEDPCAVCKRVCCAFRAAVLALDVHKDGSLGRIMAVQRIQEITKVFPYGREAPTFLQCTAGVVAGDVGCGKMVCPDCCSICPDEMCGDTLCRRCKPAMWEDCDWHR